MKERSTELVQGFRHSVPYINAHRGKTFVVMLGGEAIEHENFSSIVNDIGLLHSLGIRLVVVYGARPQIDSNLAQHHYEPVYHKHTRVTDARTLEMVKQAAGLLQLDITARLSMSLNNTPLQGAHINVVSGNFIIAQPLGVDDGVDYCHSGRIRRIDEEAIHRQLDNGAIVLLGPVAVSVTGESFNLTSEEVATQLAIKLKAEKMIGFCSSQGVTDSEGNIISELFPNDAQKRIEDLEQEGRLLAWTANIAHWNDISGMVPGSLSTEATEIFQEGLRLPESVLLQTVTGDYVEDDIYYELLDPADIDMICRPDQNAVYLVPWAIEPTAQVIHDTYDKQGNPPELSPYK